MIMTAQDDDDYYYCTAYSIAHCYVALVLIDLRIGILTGKRCAAASPQKTPTQKKGLIEKEMEKLKLLAKKAHINLLDLMFYDFCVLCRAES